MELGFSELEVGMAEEEENLLLLSTSAEVLLRLATIDGSAELLAGAE